MIVNVFDKEIVHRIQLSPDSESIKICATYITDTRDLFILVYKNLKKRYYFYMIDLDESNIRERNEDANENDSENVS